ncbi:MAG: hypothetical protein SVY53_08810 [Chloroflexota bacterium]|nr:hypothetical protein [Chloroflexota bacterium]
MCRLSHLRVTLFTKGGNTFNPVKARVRIRRLVGADTEYAISFTEECDNCGICARWCPYGALIQEKGKGAD